MPAHTPGPVGSGNPATSTCTGCGAGIVAYEGQPWMNPTTSGLKANLAYECQPVGCGCEQGYCCGFHPCCPAPQVTP